MTGLGPTSDFLSPTSGYALFNHGSKLIRRVLTIRNNLLISKLSDMYRIFNHCLRSSQYHLKRKMLIKGGNHEHFRQVDKRFSVLLSTPSELHTKRDTRMYPITKGLHMITDTIKIRRCRETDIKTFMQLSRKEGWDNTEFDCYAALKLDPDYFIVAADDADNPLGFVGLNEMFSGTCYGNNFIVNDAVRGRGIGRRLMAAVLERLEERNLCIDAAENLIPFYGEYGMLYESFRCIARRGIVTSRCKELKTNGNEFDIVPLTDDTWHDLLDYDRTVYKGITREKNLKVWFVGDCVYTVVAFCKGIVSGYGCFLKTDYNQYHIQTIFGDNSKVVDEILDNMLDNIPLGADLTFVLLADKEVPNRFLGFEPTVVTHRLSTKFTIETESDKMFYICYQFV